MKISHELRNRLVLEECRKLLNKFLVLLNGLSLACGECDTFLEHISVELILWRLLQVSLEFSETLEVIFGSLG